MTTTTTAAAKIEWLDREEAAQYCGMSPATLEGLASRGGGPVYFKAGRRARYRREDLDVWLQSRRFAFAAERS